MDRPVARVNSTALVEQRRSQIVSAATSLITRKGFARTTVKDIANFANVSTGLVYEYVRNKDDILFLVFEYWGEVWIQAVEEALATTLDPLSRLREVVSVLIDLTVRYPHVTHLFYYEVRHLNEEGRELSKRGEERLTSVVAGVVDQGREDGLLRQDVNAQVLASSMLLLTQGWSLKAYILHDQCTADEYGSWLIDGVIRGSATDDGLARWNALRHRP